MKKIFVILLLLSSAVNADAKCAYTGLEVWPKSGKIKQNAVFLIEGYAASQEKINGLNDKYPVYLKSENHKVKLIVKEKYIGQFALTQVLLVPEENLVVNETYELLIENTTDATSITQWEDKLKKYETVKWKIGPDTDSEKPVWLEKPTEKNKIFQEMGCGPEVFVAFSCKVKDETQVFIKTKVKSIDTGKTVVYILPIINDQIMVGHGMCSGAFKLMDSRNFEVEFSLLDEAGNLTTGKEKPILFSSPIYSNN